MIFSRPKIPYSLRCQSFYEFTSTRSPVELIHNFGRKSRLSGPSPAGNLGGLAAPVHAITSPNNDCTACSPSTRGFSLNLMQIYLQNVSVDWVTGPIPAGNVGCRAQVRLGISTVSPKSGWESQLSSSSPAGNLRG